MTCLHAGDPQRRGKRASGAPAPTGLDRDDRNLGKLPRRGSRCCAGPARSGATRSFVHSQLSDSCRCRHGAPPPGHTPADQPGDASGDPARVRLLSCGAFGLFGIPAAFEAAAGQRPPAAYQLRPPRPARPRGARAAKGIVIRRRRRDAAGCGVARCGAARCGMPLARRPEILDFEVHCPPSLPLIAAGGREQPARRSRSRGRRRRVRSRSWAAKPVGANRPRLHRRKGYCPSALRWG
jgi:hypothetical protein